MINKGDKRIERRKERRLYKGIDIFTIHYQDKITGEIKETCALIEEGDEEEVYQFMLEEGRKNERRERRRELKRKRRKESKIK